LKSNQKKEKLFIKIEVNKIKNKFIKIINFFNNRYLVLIVTVIIIAVIYVFRLFSLQIINGAQYRERSQKRMLRQEVVYAPRGQITDRNGVILATNKLSYDVLLYRVNVDSKVFNDSIATLINILEENGDVINTSFPINEDYTALDFNSEEEFMKWKKELNLKESYSHEDVINYYIDKYDLSYYKSDISLMLKIMAIKYEGNLYGYSLFNGITVAKNISDKSLAMIEENLATLYGVSTKAKPMRVYPNFTLASHIIGYSNKINSEEYSKLKDEGYTINSDIGKIGIEKTFESTFTL